MLILDIETMQIDGKDFIWEFAAVDTKTGLYAHLINEDNVKGAIKFFNRTKRYPRFFEHKQIQYCYKNRHLYIDSDGFKYAINKIIENHKVVAAYNISFDKRHLQNIGINFDNTRSVCLWGSFINSHVNSRYFKWAFDNEYVTPKGNPKTDAETAYKYVTGDTGYIHQHFALADCWTEATIWENIKKRKGKLEESTTFSDVQKKLKKYRGK
jgi:hypothetical protein